MRVRQLVIAASLLLAGCRQILGIDGEASALDGSTSGITVGFTASESLVDEASGTVEIAVTLSEPSNQPVTVKFDLTGGSAEAVTDYAFVGGGTLGFSPGETTQTIAIDIVQDLAEEPDETIELTLSSPTGADLGTTTHSITISTDILPRVSITTPTSMGMENVSTIVVVALDVASTRTVTVQFELSGTAAASDHTLAAVGVLTFPVGTTSHEIEVGIVDDSLNEFDEDLVISLTAATDAIVTAGQSAHAHTIVDNDPMPTLTLSPAGQACPEGATIQTMGTLSAASGKAIDAQVVPFYETATAQDAAPLNGTSMAFAPGETTKILVLNCIEDPTDEPDETLRIQFGSIQNAMAVGGPSVVTVTDNDAPSVVTFGAATSSAAEGDVGQTTFNINVLLDRASAFMITAPFTVGGSATMNDFSLVTPSPIMFAPGEITKTLQFKVNGDFTNEASETVIFSLSDTPTNAVKGTPGMRTHTITDDD